MLFRGEDSIIKTSGIWDKRWGIPSWQGGCGMIFIIRKRHIAAAAVLCVALIGAVLMEGHGGVAQVFAPRTQTSGKIVVLDPGHGGEDGGAVSGDGAVTESGLNLEIALRVRDLMTFSGVETVVTRSEDVSTYTEGATIRQRKVSDLKNRVALVNGTENAVLVSIHQNSLPSSPSTHGAQVFWNEQPGAQDLAGEMQEALNQCINPERPKEAKEIADTIYLLKNATAPGVIVECGFLSNQAETARLEEPPHQRLLAAAITTGYLRWGSEEGAT